MQKAPKWSCWSTTSSAAYQCLHQSWSILFDTFPTFLQKLGFVPGPTLLAKRVLEWHIKCCSECCATKCIKSQSAFIRPEPKACWPLFLHRAFPFSRDRFLFWTATASNWTIIKFDLSLFMHGNCTLGIIDALSLKNTDFQEHICYFSWGNSSPFRPMCPQRGKVRLSVVFVLEPACTCKFVKSFMQ